MQTVLSILILAAVVFGVAKLLPGIRCKGFGTALIVAVVISGLNFVVYKLLFFLSLPIVILSGFVGYFALNTVVLWLTDQLIEDFEIKGLGTTLIASLLISIANTILQALLL